VGHALHLVRRRGGSEYEAFGKNVSAQTAGVETHRLRVHGSICSRDAADNRREETETLE